MLCSCPIDFTSGWWPHSAPASVHRTAQRATPPVGAGNTAQQSPGAGVPVDGGHAVHQQLPRRRVDADQVAPLHAMCPQRRHNGEYHLFRVVKQEDS